MAEEMDRDIRMWAMFCHLAALAGYLIPFGNIIGPLIVWQVKKEDSPFIDEHGREAVNFQICCTIYLLVAAMSIVVVVGFAVVPLVIVFQIALTIVAAIKANSGESFRYPFIFRVV